jgi:hypothetical protein
MRTTTKNKSDKGSSAAAAANGLPNPKGNPIPKRKYDLSRPYCTGDEVYVCKCYGRANGLPESILDTIARVERDEDNVGTVKIASALLPEPIIAPVCNLKLIRAIEDIPQFAIFSQNNGYYITTKGLDEAVGAVWYGGKTGVLQKDANALAELMLEFIKENNPA